MLRFPARDAMIGVVVVYYLRKGNIHFITYVKGTFIRMSEDAMTNEYLQRGTGSHSRGPALLFSSGCHDE
jgi:hypothetical protein